MSLFEIEKQAQVSSQELLVIAHTYQPPRSFLELGEDQQRRADIVAYVNEQVYNQCYCPLFIKNATKENPGQLPSIGIFSLFGVLRDWWEYSHPETYEILARKIQDTPYKEYRVLGDSYLHFIFPVESPENQEMWIKIGLRDFENRFGFLPKGFWLPETAVSQATLNVLYENGIEFVILRDDQLERVEQNPMWIPVRARNGQTGAMAVIFGESALSGSVSFDNNATSNADMFLLNNRGRQVIAVMSDTELYGHHKPFRDKFFHRLADSVQKSRHNFRPFDVKSALTVRPKKETKIRDFTSWSCSHQLGRWTGTEVCNCSEMTEKQYKKYLREEMKRLGDAVDGMLFSIDPDWREQFIPFFLAVKSSLFFQGDIREDISRLRQNGDVPLLANPKAEILFLAQLARWIGNTSCAWFFPGNDRIERRIAEINIEQIKKLLAKIEESHDM